jgi:hypothetical protein
MGGLVNHQDKLKYLDRYQYLPFVQEFQYMLGENRDYFKRRVPPIPNFL